jgi:hypothetical protein
VPRTYDPATSYNTGATERKVAAQNTVAPIVGRRSLGNPNFWKIAAILDSNTDERLRHIITAADIASPYNFTFRVPHGLSIVPTVEGSFALEEDAPCRGLPYENYQDGVSYFGLPPDFTVRVDKIDTLYITVRVVIHNTDGLTIFTALLGKPIYTKFYCFQDGTV